MMKIKSRLTQHIIVALIPILILLSMTLSPLLTVMFGKEIILGTEPVDPRDFFRGDYVILNYDINSISLDLVEKSVIDEYDNKDYGFLYEPLEVYVLLKFDESSGYHIPEKVVLERPKSDLYIKGTVSYIRDHSDNSEEHVILIDYQLDSYYVPENTGFELEEASSEDNLKSIVKVLNGKSVLVDVEITD